MQRLAAFILVLCLVIAPAISLGAGTPDYLDDEFYDDDPGPDTSRSINDPLEPFNRAMFGFNQTIYDYILRPVTIGYRTVLPSDVRGVVSNTFHNAEAPLRFVNSLLQGRFSDAGTVLARFLINTTFGAWGMGDPAAREFGLEPVDASMGQTLGVWGIGDGFYLYLPLYGPTTLRDMSGDIVDGLFFTPYYYPVDGFAERMAIYSYREENELSFSIDEYDDMMELTIDPYVAIRDAYYQYRQTPRSQAAAERRQPSEE